MITRAICLLLFLETLHPVSATHIRGAELMAVRLDTLLVEATLELHFNNVQMAHADSIAIDWGDNTSSILAIIDSSAYPNGHVVVQFEDTHSYATLQPFYVISVTVYNRSASIINISNGNSSMIPLYVEDTIFLNSSYTYNNVPSLQQSLIVFGNIHDSLHFNSAAYDPDGDSLSFHWVVPLAAKGFPVPNYQMPDDVLPGPNNQLHFDTRDGAFLWATPQMAGFYVLAFVMREYRNGVLLNSSRHELLIIVMDGPLGEEAVSNPDLRPLVFPNPFQHTLMVTLPVQQVSAPAILQLYNAHGKMVLESTLHTNHGHWTFDLSALPSAVYMYRFRAKAGQLHTGKLMKH